TLYPELEPDLEDHGQRQCTALRADDGGRDPGAYGRSDPYTMTPYPVLSATTFVPVAGAALILLFRSDRLARWMALVTTLATLAASAPLYWRFDKGSSGLQFVESAQWIPSWNITYSMGVDGISLLLISLASLLTVLCIGASWRAIQTR